MIENMTSIKQLFLLDVTLSMLLDHILTQKSIYKTLYQNSIYP